MMIYRKGEMVYVEHEKLFGRVCFVGNIDVDTYPFAIATYDQKGKNILLCSHDELRLANKWNDMENIRQFRLLEKQFRDYL